MVVVVGDLIMGVYSNLPGGGVLPTPCSVLEEDQDWVVLPFWNGCKPSGLSCPENLKANTFTKHTSYKKQECARTWLWFFMFHTLIRNKILPWVCLGRFSLACSSRSAGAANIITNL